MNNLHGDLIELTKQGNFDVIVHGCNCFNTMGAGIAKSIKNAWPKAYNVDRSTVKGDRKKLGTYSECHEKNIIILNAYTQYYFGSSRGKNVDYMAIRNVFRRINQNFKGMIIGIPKIGAGLAGGNWEIIENIINKETPDVKVILVIYKPNK